MAASKELLLIYQDCPLCGAREGWGDEQVAAAQKAGVEFRKVSFVAQEAQGMAQKALKAGIASMPYFTDGTHFAKTVEELLALTAPKKRVAKKVKEEKNGDLAES